MGNYLTKPHSPKIILTLLPAIIVALCGTALAAENRSTNIIETVRSAIKTGELAFRLTTPAEFKGLLGAPEKEDTRKDGEATILLLDYPGVQAVFGRMGNSRDNTHYTLVQVAVDRKPLDIGSDKPITLRRLEDLAKPDTFWGLANVSLVKLDLTDQMPRLAQLPFDSRTQWPPRDKLPNGFDPAQLLDDGKNPGLGVRKLHEQGIDGRGIRIAIIDQPLLRDHQEYKDRVIQYTEIDVQGVPAQMHGSPVTSIAVGKSCGTAPEASVEYYAVPTWKWWNEHCKPYAATLERIIERNKQLAASEKVRVVSLSLGAFSQWPDHEVWSNAVQHATDEGIFVVTCDPLYQPIACLKHMPGVDADSPSNYVNQFAFPPKNALGVPAGNRSTASHTGPADYVFWREGGMSWTVPYLAGLAALACQVDPELNPKSIRALWTKTATKTSAGLVVNPPAFIEAVRAAKAKSRHVRSSS
jgi:hypothetical protein